MTELAVAFSKLKPAQKFQRKWSEHGFDGGKPELEFAFADDRKWRFDFAWPKFKVAVEIDGFGYGHQAQQNLAAQNQKQNMANELGWIVLRYNSRQLGSHGSTMDAVHQVMRVLMDRGEAANAEF